MFHVKHWYKNMNFKYSFNDEELQQKFERFFNEMTIMIPNLDFDGKATQVSYATAKSVVNGKYSEILKENKNNYDNTAILITQDTKYKVKNHNAYTGKHEQAIYQEISLHSGNNLIKLINQISLLNRLLRQENYSYNAVFYDGYNNGYSI